MTAPHNPQRKTALITGGSAGLGLEIARVFAASDYDVVIVGRNQQRLEAASRTAVRRDGTPAIAIVGDLSHAEACQSAAEQVRERTGRLDVLVNCIGASDRGLAKDLTAQRIHELIDQNVTATLLCTQAMLPLLSENRGSIVNIGSLAGKVGARYLGGYNLAKHALTGLTQQLRLELRETGVHVGLVSPGPIRREDAGNRYDDRTDASLPEQARAPGGGTKVKGLDPRRVAVVVRRCAEERIPDIVLPGYLRLLIALGHISPPLGDWLLLKFTSKSQ